MASAAGVLNLRYRLITTVTHVPNLRAYRYRGLSGLFLIARELRLSVEAGRHFTGHALLMRSRGYLLARV
jgi:hypothetical protein